ncbi:glycosyltransferase [Algihabitans albus]|uniref:glycosyltransferase n=1 Tax=Algihabitans albus TaxID=2164067 RepID=UPI000E5D0DCA|nr:glycosyltransferase family 4 protein [Algihabitans albus]
MTTLILSTSYPRPTDVGRKVVMSGFLDWLSVRAAGERVVYAHLAPRQQERHERLAVDLYEARVDPSWRRLGGMAVEGLLRGRTPLQIAAVGATGAATTLARLVGKLAPDLVVADTLRVVPVLDRLPLGAARKVVYLDDLYSRRYARLIETLDRHPDAELNSLGTFARFLPAWMARIARVRGLQRALLQREMRLMETAENAAPARFDRCLLLNEQEADVLRTRSGADNIFSVPPYVRVRESSPEQRPVDPPCFLFLGNLSYPANAYGLSRFLSETVPPLFAALPQARLDIVGGGASPALQAHVASLGERVRLRGFVDDLDGVLAGATALVAPVIYGTGVKIKVIDALARGLPIVSTPTGAEGIEVVDGREGFLRDDLADFVEPLRRLTDPDVNRACSEAALQLYHRRYRRDAAFAAYEEAFA